MAPAFLLKFMLSILIHNKLQSFLEAAIKSGANFLLEYM